MDLHVRPVSGDEFPAFLRVEHAAFGLLVDDEAVEGHRHRFEPDRSRAAFDGDTLVASAGSFSFDLTLPGLATVPVAAVSHVGVLPSHRRRGILDALMAAVLEDTRARGEPLAVLTASEAAIYPRYGYGIATLAATFDVGLPAGAALRARAGPGRVRLAGGADIAEAAPAVYDRYRRETVGELSRTEGWWRSQFAVDRPRSEEGHRFWAVSSGPDGRPDGFCSYRFRERWSAGGLPEGRVTVDELCSADAGADAALLGFLFGLDLAADVRFLRRPVDDPLRWRLTDSRRLLAKAVGDWLWARPVDAAAVLAARRYRVEGRVGLRLADPACPWNDATWVVEGGPAGAACRAAPAGEADLALGPSELGSVLLGGVRPSALVRAGRVDELTPGAAARADAMLGTDPEPWCSTEF